MIDNVNVICVLPDGPYPQCTEISDVVRCSGTLVPLLKPSDNHNTAYPTPIKGTVVVYWKCSKCGKTTG
jgi:hypothetical protein